jgi:predicted PurR-regulated permease PerM
MGNQQKLEITTGSWVRGVIVIAVAYAFYLSNQFILVIITSVVIASATEPLVGWTKKRNVSRLFSVILIYVVTALVLVSLFYFLLLPLVGEVSSFIRTLTVYSNSVTNGGVLSDIFRTQNMFGGFDTPVLIKQFNTQLNVLANFLSQGIFSSATLIFGGVLNFVLIIVLSFYLTVQEDGISKFLKIITPIQHEQYVIGLWRRSQHKIGLWMQGQILSSALMTLLFIALLIIGVPHALLLAVLAGIFELIPLFGATLAAIPTLYIAYTSAGMNTALIVAGIYVLIQQIESHVIYPLVQRKMIGILPIISIMALVVGGTLAGFLGVLIAVPMAAVMMEFFSDLEERKIAQSSDSVTPS